MKGSSFVKGLVAGVLLVLAAMPFQSAKAADFPSETISIIVPWPPGGGSDILMRMLAEAATAEFGSPVIVVNRPGAAGAVGLREAAEAEPDGYTLGMIATGFIAQQYSNPQANALDDYEMVVYVGTDPAALSVNAETGIETLADFVEAAKAEPGGILNGNDPPVGSSYLAIALMENTLGVTTTRVPYQGYAPTITALVAGEVQSATVAVPDLVEHAKQGTITILAVSGDNRHPMAPDVPTFQEEGYDLVTGTFRALVAPKGTPDNVLDTLEAGFLAAMNSEAFRERAIAAGYGLGPQGRAWTAEFVYGMDADMYPVLLDAGMVRARQKE